MERPWEGGERECVCMCEFQLYLSETWKEGFKQIQPVTSYSPTPSNLSDSCFVTERDGAGTPGFLRSNNSN